MNFEEYQKKVSEHPLYDDVILGLVGEVGEVVELIKKDRRQGTYRKILTKDRLEEELGDVMWYLSRVCTVHNINLNELVENNIKKLNERHGIEKK